MLVLLILYCISTENFKCMALLYCRANMLTIPISIGYTAVYGILGNQICMYVCVLRRRCWKWSFLHPFFSQFRKRRGITTLLSCR
jgi:hypothetical protein